MSQYYKVILSLFLTCSILFGANLKGQNRLINGVEQYRLIVKFDYAVRLSIDGTTLRLQAPAVRNNSALQDVVSQYQYKQVLSFDEKEQENIRRGSFENRKGGFNRLLFSGLVELLDAPGMSPEEVLALANYLETFDEVEYCAIEDLTPTPPPSTIKNRATPDFSWRQWYREYMHGGDTIGINIEAAWAKGVKGKGVSIADIEWGMDYDHEDLKSSKFIEGLKTTNSNYDDHGTAVAGVLIAQDNGFGVTGMVPEYDAFYGFSEITKGRVTAIAMAIDSLDAGDVIIYEMQTGGQNGEYVPADYNQGVWDITKTATDAGIIVCAAAGNGNQNLDGSFYSAYMDRGDNGAIIVGAGTIKGRNKASFSTYGSRVDVQGWGDYCVTTTGYTSLYDGGPHAKYTKNFSGTSSATPIVSSAVVAIQSYALNALGKKLTPKEMRALLKKTGTPQGSGGHIGPLPNVGAAIEELGGSIEDTYKLDVIGGTGDGSFKEGDTITVTAEEGNGSQLFISWSGDTAYVVEPSKKSTKVIMPAKDITIKAEWVLDTLKSQDLLPYGGWSGIMDTLGSKAVAVLDSTGDLLTSVKIDLELISAPNDTTYPYANLTGYFEKSFDDVHTIELAYSASEDFRFLLPMKGGTDSDGSAHYIVLPKAQDTIIQFTPSNCMQPDWQENKTALDLSNVFSISLELDSKSKGSCTLHTLKMVDYTPVSITVNQTEQAAEVLFSIQNNALTFTCFESGPITCKLYSLQGKELISHTINSKIGIRNLLVLPSGLAQSVVIVRLEGKSFHKSFRTKLK